MSGGIRNRIRGAQVMSNKMLACLCAAVCATVFAENDANKMGFNHLGAEFGAYDVDATGGIKLGGVKKGGNRLG